MIFFVQSQETIHASERLKKHELQRSRTLGNDGAGRGVELEVEAELGADLEGDVEADLGADVGEDVEADLSADVGLGTEEEVEADAEEVKVEVDTEVELDVMVELVDGVRSLAVKLCAELGADIGVLSDTEVDVVVGVALAGTCRNIVVVAAPVELADHEKEAAMAAVGIVAMYGTL
ncbi:hypothetical protein G3M48_000503 [Beauveria asiatica]|uniref:Uncharacterized protein n=1 Tax=Beauveria asiatica TaxID=1069075 RepID=A0AAW0S8U2_9HYPO